MKGFNKAIKLEIKSMMERKFSLLFYLVVPTIIIGLFYMVGMDPLTYGDFAYMNLKIYDIFGPAVFLIITIFITTQLMVLRIVGERAPYGTLDRELIAISRPGMLLGKFVANMIFATLQCIMVWIGGYYLFPAQNYGAPPLVFLSIWLVGIFGLTSGLAISVFSKNREQAVQLIPLFILGLLLLSGVLPPLEQMPPQMAKIAGNVPLTLGINSLQELAINGVGLEDVTSGLLLLLGWIVSILLISMLKFCLEK